MVIIKCEPIKKIGPDKYEDGYENVVVRDTKGYPFAILFMDLFHDQNDQRIYDKIRAGKEFQIKVDIVE